MQGGTEGTVPVVHPSDRSCKLGATRRTYLLILREKLFVTTAIFLHTNKRWSEETTQSIFFNLTLSLNILCYSLSWSTRFGDLVVIP